MQIYKETAQGYPRDDPPSPHRQGSRHRHKKHQGWELGVWGWTALKWPTQETVWFFFPPKPLSVKWGYDKNCPEELLTARTLRRHLGCVAGSEAKMGIRLQSPILDRRGREAIAPFLADRHPGWGGGGKGQAAQRKEEVNKRVLKELLPIHCIRKNTFSRFSGFPFSDCKVGDHKALKR